MSLLYKIRNFDPSFGQILVHFYSEDNSFNYEMAIDLPIKDGKYPEGDELSNIINNLAPNFNFERTSIINNGITNTSVIQSLVEPYPVNVPETIEDTYDGDEPLQVRVARQVLEQYENQNNT